MPARDGSGPMGGGPMTGWGMGPCGDDRPRTYSRRGRRAGYGNRCGGYGRGQGRGYARGFGPGFVDQPYDALNDRDMLEAERDRLQARLDAIANQLKEG